MYSFFAYKKLLIYNKLDNNDQGSELKALS